MHPPVSVIGPAPGDVIGGGRYRIERPLARGGMGSVFVARHMQLDVLFAIKFIDPAMASASNARARFEREAKAAAQIRNPNVVQVFDHGLDNGVPYLVMELLEGEDLGARLRREKRLPLPQVVSLMNQLAKGLRRAHESGIVHRDLKPGNIFMATIEDEEVVKILDFGLAKAFLGDTADEVTVSGVVLGSPQYMSPEQARGMKQIDHRSDIWSLGVILYRCITGSLPFQSDQVGELVIKICTENPPPPTRLVPTLPYALDSFFDRAFERDVERRFQSVREMATELAATVTRASTPDAQTLLVGPPSSPISGPLSSGPRASVPSPEISPLFAPAPGMSPWPAADAADTPLVPPFRDPLGGPPENDGRRDSFSIGLPTYSQETTTVPAMVPARIPQRASSRTFVLVIAGSALAAILGTSAVLSMRAAPDAREGAATSAPATGASASASAAAGLTVTPTATAPSPPSAAPTAEAAATEPIDLDADADAGAEPALTSDPAPRPVGPVKKRRNFGY